MSLLTHGRIHSLDMYIDFSKLFHNASKDRRDQGTRFVPTDHSLWPPEWRTVAYKIYEKLPKITFGGALPSSALFDILKKRASKRNYSGKPLTRAEIFTLLTYGCGETGAFDGSGMPRRTYPSGGSRYPVETYLLILQDSTELAAGLYHYETAANELAFLAPKDLIPDTSSLFSYQWVGQASAVILLTGVFERSKQKYGQRGYTYTLLEAGHIGQNFYLISEVLGISCCALSGIEYEPLERLMAIDGTNESVVYSIAFGK